MKRATVGDRKKRRDLSPNKGKRRGGGGLVYFYCERGGFAEFTTILKAVRRRTGEL